RAAMYMLRDTESKSGTQFNTSGLTSRKSEKHQPKPSWYYVFTLKNVLKGHVFSADYSTKAIMQYDFKTIDEKSGVLVVWLPTSKAAKIEAVDIEIPSKARTATLIKF